MHEFERVQGRLRSALAAERFRQAALRVQRLLSKYNPNWHLQPRVPAGNRDGGQWVAYLLGAAASILPILQRVGAGAIARLREEARHAWPLLRRLPRLWGSDDSFPKEEQFDQETRRIGPQSLRRSGHAFIRFRSMGELRRYLGPAGPGREWHHIVEQRLAEKGIFTPEEIHNTDNIINLPIEVHRRVSARMSRRYEAFISNIRRFEVEILDFSEQYNQGINLVEKTLREFGYDPEDF